MIESIQSNSTTTLVLMPKKELDAIRTSLDELKVLIAKSTKESTNPEWVESGEARRLLGVSQKTWQNYRDKKVIPFSQFGRKIYVLKADINAFLENHKIDAHE